MSKLRPTMKLRLKHDDSGYRYETFFYGCRGSEPVLRLQQWWEWPDGRDDEGYPADGEWRDVEEAA